MLWQLGAPVVLILLNAMVPVTSWLSLVSRFVGVFLVIACSGLSGIWLFPPWWTPWLLGGLHIALTVYAVSRLQKKRPVASTLLRGADLFAGVLLILAATTMFVPALSGRKMPVDATPLNAPLEAGRYLTVNGGTTEPVNAHLMTLTATKYKTYRGQSYGVDIVEIDSFGRRTAGISPADPAAYFIYGKRILAPCSGIVRKAVDGVNDMQVPLMDREHMLGNHVIIECHRHKAFVVLAHMSPDSVVVTTGSSVRSGDELGRVGNTGNTAEPHLHIHVQRTLPDDEPISSDPLWFTIADRFIVRNNILVFP